MNDRQFQTKKNLVNAAIEKFYENGFQKTRVSDIVAAAGVAQGTFYLYFKSKEDIFQHVCTEFTTLFTNLIEEADYLFSGESFEAVRQNLMTFITELIGLFTANNKSAKIILYEGGSFGGQFTTMFENIYAQFIDIVSRRLEQNLKTGYISFEDAETEAAFLIGLFDRSLFYFMDVRKKIDVETLGRRMTEFIMGGLCNKHRDRQ